ncbi:MAG TPA: TetR/AcrR family transcriptional regulator, partial [Amycolatopsis sp.]|nr:TetR/AcrR family transcriptional regulator [Amycolatopsis sp.]
MRSNQRDDSPTFTERARRAQIVACAIEVIAEIGYAQTSIRKIARRVGVAMSVVLYHFANKDELVRAIAMAAYRSAVAAMVPALDAEATAAGRLRAYIRSHVAFISTHRTQFMAVLDIALSYRSATGHRLDQLEVDPGLHGDLAKLDLESLFRQGQEAGEFRPFDARSVAVALRGALNNAVLETARDPGFDVLAYGEELVVVFAAAT